MIGRKRKLINSFILQKNSILDVGCATGKLFDYINHDTEYTGLEYNNEMIKFCKKKGLNVVSHDLNSGVIPFGDKKFDVIYCSHVIEHFSTTIQIKLFQEFNRILKDNGKIIIFTPTGYHYTFIDDETHVRGHSHISLTSLASNTGFQIVECKYSFTRIFPQKMQGFFRLYPFLFYLSEVYLIGQKTGKNKFSKMYN